MDNLIEKIKSAASAILGSRSYVSAVILAGGGGTRFGGDVTKQMVMLSGKPLIVHSMLAFQDSEYIDEIIVVAKSDEIEAYSEYAKKYSVTKLSKVVAGGSTRQQSAKNGFDSICKKADYVVIHDGARPLVTKEIIKEVVLSAYAHGAATAACRATDTVKYSGGVTVEQTLDRNNVWLTQTPQAFKDEIYRAAAYTAEKNGFSGTDDASLVENIDISVYLVDCGRDNFKVTYKNDLIMAEILLSQRKN